MQTVTNLPIVSVSEQVAILHASQVRVGSFVTGAVMEHLWEVVAVHGTGGMMDIVRFPRVTPMCAEHTFVSYGRGERCMPCGLRRMAIREFLPKKPDKPRAYIIQPQGAVCTPVAGAVYVGIHEDVLGYYTPMDITQPSNPGEAAVPGSRNSRLQWDAALPLFPRLLCVWSVPPALQALCNESDMPTMQDPHIANEVRF